MNMRESKLDTGRWYLYLVAIYYGVLCSICGVRYIYLDLTAADVYVAPLTQILCFVAAISGILFFVRRTAGYWGLIAVTVLALCTAPGHTDAKAIAFHAAVLAILLLPVLKYHLAKKTRATDPSRDMEYVK
jgi:hypothetical protein